MERLLLLYMHLIDQYKAKAIVKTIILEDWSYTSRPFES